MAIVGLGAIAWGLALTWVEYCLGTLQRWAAGRQSHLAGDRRTLLDGLQPNARDCRNGPWLRHRALLLLHNRTFHRSSRGWRRFDGVHDRIPICGTPAIP